MRASPAPQLVLLWGAVVEPRFILTVSEETAEIPGLAPCWEGQRVALLADWKVGIRWANVGMVRRAVSHVARARPAAVLLAGDFVYVDPAAGYRELSQQLDTLNGARPAAGALLDPDVCGPRQS